MVPHPWRCRIWLENSLQEGGYSPKEGVTESRGSLREDRNQERIPRDIGPTLAATPLGSVVYGEERIFLLLCKCENSWDPCEQVLDLSSSVWMPAQYWTITQRFSSGSKAHGIIQKFHRLSRCNRPI